MKITLIINGKEHDMTGKFKTIEDAIMWLEKLKNNKVFEDE